ncbi:FUSC family protein [Streptomyces anulatus]
MLPLVIGVASEEVQGSVKVATGALIVGFVDPAAPNRRRLSILYLAPFAVAASSLIGALTGGRLWLSALEVGVWSFAAALALAFERQVAMIILLSSWALLLAQEVPLRPQAAAVEAGLVLAGGALSALLQSCALAFRPLTAERMAVERVYRALADYARGHEDGMLRQSARELALAESLLRRGGDPAQPYLRLCALADEGEWIRSDIAAIWGHHESRHPRVTDFMTAISGSLDSVADAVAGAKDASPTTTPEAKRCTAGMPQELVQRARTLSGRARSAAHWASTSSVSLPQQTAPALPGGPRPLRTVLSWRSRTLRHAVRLSVTMMVAVVTARLMGLHEWYWAPLAVLFLLKPDFGTTLSRMCGRASGTIIGVVCGTLITTLIQPPPGVVVTLLTAFVAAGFIYYPVNYACFSASFAVVVALLADLLRNQPAHVLGYRVIDTAVGLTLALAAYLIWPTWERAQAGEEFTELIDAERRWLACLLNAHVDPSAFDRPRLRKARLEARRRQDNAEAGLERTLSEPLRVRFDTHTATAILEASNRRAATMYVLLAHLHQSTSPRPHPEIELAVLAIDNLMADVSCELNAMSPLRENAVPRHKDRAHTPAHPRVEDRLAQVQEQLEQLVAELL